MKRSAKAFRPLTAFVMTAATLGMTLPVRAAEEDRVRMAASERYEAGRTHRFTFGGGYRDLWEAEIELPVLDLAQTGGGLVPTGRFGGLQTAVLGFKGADGRSYSFRGTDKDPSVMLDEELLDTVVRTMVQDQMAAQHPGAPPVVSVLAEAAGLLTIHERSVVMPDDPVLGEFREEFAGMVGSFYEFPMPADGKNPGYRGASEIIGYEDLYARLEAGEAGEAEVDAEAFLRARLFDLLIGDFDRHRKQWRWAKLPGDPRWKPIPEDRDMAFVRYEGGLIRTAAVYFPILQDYGPDYPSMQGLTLHGWEQDRWLLPALSWEQWDAIARDMQARITNLVIDDAIGQLPIEYATLDGERLRHDLRSRRDQLHEAARAYYEHLAGQVDVQLSNAGEQVEVTRGEKGAMQVEIRPAGDPAAPPLFSRRFERGDTREVRIYLRDGDDRVNVSGGGCYGLPGCVRLRVIAGQGEKALDDSSGGGTQVYDEHGSIEVTEGTLTRVFEAPYVPPDSDGGFVDVDDVPPRDWGSTIVPVPVFGYERDVGVYLGAGVIYKRYGFRKQPWSSRFLLSAGWATEANEPRVKFESAFRLERRTNLVAHLDLLYSGIEVLRWYGFGNETGDGEKDSFYRVRNRLVYVAPRFSLDFLEATVRLSTGLYIGKSTTKDGDRFIDIDDPYGSGDFALMSFYARGRYDTRRMREGDLAGFTLPIHDNPAAGFPVSGMLLDLRADISPPAMDVVKTWGSLDANAAVYLTGREEWGDTWGWLDRFTLALRMGGRVTWGKVPYFQAAFIGGGGFFSGHASVRGFREQRFAGDYSFFSNNELRVFLFRTKLIVPTDVGVLAFGDVGRVWVDGEKSDKWHPGGGGGIWLSPLSRVNTLSLMVGASTEETLFYMRMGFHF
jgi:hypothetical protein